jgi:transcriptional regulator with XRE-family HTH domain
MTYRNRLCDNMATMAGPAERVRLALERWLDTTKLTQRQFAKDLNKSQPWLDKVLQGVNHVRLEDLDDIAAALRTSAAELVRTDDERYRLELTPTEVRLIERIRHRPGLIDAVTFILDEHQLKFVLPEPKKARNR